MLLPGWAGAGVQHSLARPCRPVPQCVAPAAHGHNNAQKVAQLLCLVLKLRIPTPVAKCRVCHTSRHIEHRDAESTEKRPPTPTPSLRVCTPCMPPLGAGCLLHFFIVLLAAFFLFFLKSPVQSRFAWPGQAAAPRLFSLSPRRRKDAPPARTNTPFTISSNRRLVYVCPRPSTVTIPSSRSAAPSIRVGATSTTLCLHLLLATEGPSPHFTYIAVPTFSERRIFRTARSVRNRPSKVP